MSGDFDDAPGELSIEVIRRHLRGDTFACHVYLFNEVSSTSAVLDRLAHDGAREGTVVIADSETTARGRLGKPWFSPPAVNVYTSVLLRPDIPLKSVPVFSFIASLALCDTIRQYQVPVSIKWPSDILVGDRKIAEVLAHCGPRGEGVDYVILGVGVNVNVSDEALARALGGEAALATSLMRETGQDIDRNVFVAALLNMLEKWFNVYRTCGARAIVEAYRERDAPTNRSAMVNAAPELAISGIGLLR